MKKNIIFRLDASPSKGFGHISRCLNLAEYLIPYCNLHFIIKTSSVDSVNIFINNRKFIDAINTIEYLDERIDISDDLKITINKTKETKGFLIIDHYDANEEYQLNLKKNNVKWLQFDSHAKNNLYANIVLHASPGATKELYYPLINHKNTKQLLGPKYAIINKSFYKLRKKVTARKFIKNVFICFGGGDDKGATLKVINSLNNLNFIKYNFKIFISSNNNDFETILKIVSQRNNFEIFVNQTNIAKEMLSCDIGIIAPGTLSYEAACMGLPMILISIADNQLINSKAWVEMGCAQYIGQLESLDLTQISNALVFYTINHCKINNMSTKCMKLVDGKGPIRVAKQIIKLI
jgi:UDP-2,4-diacetamido-2,4,6-trideoxy-beta-L-altropyranose hydrolase